MAKSVGARKSFSPESELGHWVAYQLRRRGLSQSQLARQLKCTPIAVTRVIHSHSVSKRIRAAVAAALGYPTWEQLSAAQRRSA